ncbi:hypothetical protein AVEN_87594-1 [Araneus ventricosus]|uniref:DUF4817 domain-containing protein n=1 Tax=Araneus ventricosus TaxID=182803 RepID=A0A4Y2LQW6_ARAVE|nr:hypothetical protein AVEN_87594-1 [Araneus ventricosus]
MQGVSAPCFRTSRRGRVHPDEKNHIAMQGRRCFFDAVDSFARKFRAFLQGIVISHKEAELERGVSQYAFGIGAADCSGPAAQRLYAERYPMRRTPSHNFFARLHRRLAETGFICHESGTISKDSGHRRECATSGIGDSKFEYAKCSTRGRGFPFQRLEDSQRKQNASVSRAACPDTSTGFLCNSYCFCTMVS